MDAPVLQTVAFHVDGDPVTWGSVVEDARRTSIWQGVEEETREGVACLAADRATGSPPSRARVRDAAARWRTRRRLTAAEDMEAWLTAWDLDVPAFLDHVARELARSGHADGAAQVRQDHPVADQDVRRRTWATGVCSGAVERAAGHLAERLAVRARLHEDGMVGKDEDLDAAWAEFQRLVVTPAALQDVVRAHRLDWLRVVGDVLVLGERDAALEARLCLLDDGATPQELVTERGIDLVREELFVEDMQQADQPEILAAAGGDVVGPFAHAAGWMLVSVDRRVEASLEDERVRVKAEAAVLAHAVTNEVDERVVWVH